MTLIVGKLHSAHLFQIDSELVLSNVTPATQESRRSCKDWNQEAGGGVKCVNIVKSRWTLPAIPPERKLAKFCVG